MLKKDVRSPALNENMAPVYRKAMKQPNIKEISCHDKNKMKAKVGMPTNITVVHHDTSEVNSGRMMNITETCIIASHLVKASNQQEPRPIWYLMVNKSKDNLLAS